jgi:aminoglycoside phosphotransferase (APT) family kinase protein
MDPWKAEIDVGEVLARRLLSRWPDLRDAPLSRLGSGFDNTAWRAGDWVFRFPRKESTVWFLRNEIDHLPRVAAALPVRTSAPERVGEPTGDYPWPYAGYRILPGHTACSALSDTDRAGLAEALGSFLRVLHAIPSDGLLDDPLQKGDVAGRARKVHAWASRLEGFTPEDLDRIEQLGRTPLWSRSPVTLHGDLYARHLLVDQGRLVGVIDWGDLMRGDPAIDLTVGMTFLPPSARPAFAEAYGPIDQDTRDRCRLHAYRYAVALLDYGRSNDDAGMTRAGLWALAGARS